MPLPERVTVRKGGGRRKEFGRPIHEALVNIAGLMFEAKAGDLPFDWHAGDRVLKSAEALVKGTGETTDHLQDVVRCWLGIGRIGAAVKEVAGRLLNGEELMPGEVEGICEDHALPLAKPRPDTEWYAKPTKVEGVFIMTRKATGILLPGVRLGDE